MGVGLCGRWTVWALDGAAHRPARGRADRLLSSALARVYSSINDKSHKANLTLAGPAIEAGPTVAKSDEAR